MDRPPRPDTRPAAGRPSASAEARFRAGLRAEVERARLSWLADLLGADAALDTGDRDAAARSLDDQREALLDLRRELDRVVAAAVVEREAESAAGGASAVLADPSTGSARPTRRTRRPRRPVGAVLAVGVAAVAAVAATLAGPRVGSPPDIVPVTRVTTVADTVTPTPGPETTREVHDGWSATAGPPATPPTGRSADDATPDHGPDHDEPTEPPGDGPEAPVVDGGPEAARIATAEDTPGDDTSASLTGDEVAQVPPGGPSDEATTPEDATRRLPLPRLSDLSGSADRGAAEGGGDVPAGRGPLDLLGRLLGG
ncbi:hypothetical protein FTX61_05910 [Nitriliruptoraceae bacterium ZYF776]|nr:hypothetical protein [Profundirhabdus halotolerans]